MNIDFETYALESDNFIRMETIKKQIVLAHSSTTHENMISKWYNRLNNIYTKTAAFSIKKDGTIYQHFDPIYCSNFLDTIDLNKKSIIILLENEGWLAKHFEKDEYINWYGNIYNNPDEVVEIKWRKRIYWVPYTSEQYESTLFLVNKLCDDFFIPKVVTQNNILVDNLNDYTGVLYRSNLTQRYTDLNPTWKFESFKYNLEKNEQENT